MVTTNEAADELAEDTPQRAGRAWPARVLFGLIFALGAWVCLEGWLATAFGSSHFEKDIYGQQFVVVDQAGWTKTVKTALYLMVFAATVVKLTLDRAWRKLTTPADIALAVLIGVLVVAGLAGDSPARLIGESLFVYLRGVIVFYALRALVPDARQTRLLLRLGGGFLALFAVIGLLQVAFGWSMYSVFGWVDHTWADTNRAQSLLDHPNDLGHLAGLGLLGLAAWFAFAEHVGKKWWAYYALVATAVATSQSRESLIGVLLGLIVIAIIRRGQWKRLVVAGLIVAVFGALPVALSAENRAHLLKRVTGVGNAVELPSGSEKLDSHGNRCTPDSPEEICKDQPGREVRVLFAQQGFELWKASPMFGYGVGQFGGIVAAKHDSQWNLSPKFKEVLGPEGFDLHHFNTKTVDSFWLHLLVETGLFGILAYLGWLFLLGAPLARRDGRSWMGAWACAALVFAALVAGLSPSLEDPLFPPLLFAVLGLAWSNRNSRKAAQT